jgi:hypothetical protein
MYNSEVKFVLNTSWQHENISCKMSLFHKRENMVVVQEKSFYLSVWEVDGRKHIRG